MALITKEFGRLQYTILTEEVINIEPRLPVNTKATACVGSLKLALTQSVVYIHSKTKASNENPRQRNKGEKLNIIIMSSDILG